MDQDDIIKGTIFTRRQAVRTVLQTGAGLALFGLMPKAARGVIAPATRPWLPMIAAPQVTEGPFFVDEKLNRSDLIGDTQRDTVTGGLPLLLTFTVYKMTGKNIAPLKDVQVDVWHADVAGVYSDESNPMNHEDTSKQTWLRGYQLTDEGGNARFKTIFPGWYPGRSPHIHFKVRHTVSGKTLEFTSQLFVRENDTKRIYAAAPYAGRGEHDTTNDNDGIYSEELTDGTTAGSHLLMDLQPDAKSRGHITSFPLILTDQSFAPSTGRHGPPGGGGFGPPPDDMDGPPRL